jgi:hypothetical protein
VDPVCPAASKSQGSFDADHSVARHFWPVAEPCPPLGAVAELERAKIIERTTRGRLHRLRMGEMSTVAVHLFYGLSFGSARTGRG